MLEDYRRGLQMGRFQICLLFAATSLLCLGSIIDSARRYAPERRTGHFIVSNKDVDGDGRADWSFGLYNNKGERIFRKSFVRRPDGNYTEFNEPNLPYKADPNEIFKRPDIRKKFV